MTRARLTQMLNYYALGAPGWLIAFQYDADLVEALKRAVPHTDRSWYEDNREWFVKETYEPVLRRLFSNVDEFKSQLRML